MLKNLWSWLWISLLSPKYKNLMSVVLYVQNTFLGTCLCINWCNELYNFQFTLMLIFILLSFYTHLEFFLIILTTNIFSLFCYHRTCWFSLEIIFFCYYVSYTSSLNDAGKRHGNRKSYCFDSHLSNTKIHYIDVYHNKNNLCFIIHV